MKFIINDDDPSTPIRRLKMRISEGDGMFYLDAFNGEGALLGVVLWIDTNGKVVVNERALKNIGMFKGEYLDG